MNLKEIENLNKFSAGEGIRTPERLHEQILSLPPLTAWLLPHIKESNQVKIELTYKANPVSRLPYRILYVVNVETK